MANRTKRTDKKRGDFLAALCDGHTVAKACVSAGISRTMAYDWKREEPEFFAAWEEAYQAGTEALEDEARRRAVDGWDEPRFYEGEQCGVVRKYSDTLLMFLLKSRDPARFADHTKMELTGKDGGPLETKDVTNFDKLTDAELQAIASGSGKG